MAKLVILKVRTKGCRNPISEPWRPLDTRRWPSLGWTPRPSITSPSTTAMHFIRVSPKMDGTNTRSDRSVVESRQTAEGSYNDIDNDRSDYKSDILGRLLLGNREVIKNAGTTAGVAHERGGQPSMSDSPSRWTGTCNPRSLGSRKTPRFDQADYTLRRHSLPQRQNTSRARDSVFEVSGRVPVYTAYQAPIPHPTSNSISCESSNNQSTGGAMRRAGFNPSSPSRKGDS